MQTFRTRILINFEKLNIINCNNKDPWKILFPNFLMIIELSWILEKKITVWERTAHERRHVERRIIKNNVKVYKRTVKVVSQYHQVLVRNIDVSISISWSCIDLDTFNDLRLWLSNAPIRTARKLHVMSMAAKVKRDLNSIRALFPEKYI